MAFNWKAKKTSKTPTPTQSDESRGGKSKIEFGKFKDLASVGCQKSKAAFTSVSNWTSYMQKESKTANGPHFGDEKEKRLPSYLGFLSKPSRPEMLGERRLKKGTTDNIWFFVFVRLHGRTFAFTFGHEI